MPKSTKTFVSKETLIDAALPAATSTYTVISHEFIINTVLQNLNDNGFNVLEEKYRCNMDGKVAQGIYKIEYANDEPTLARFSYYFVTPTDARPNNALDAFRDWLVERLKKYRER